MKKRLLMFAAAFALTASSVLAQGQNAQQPQISAAQRDAIMKVQTAYQGQNWDGTIQAITQLLENFPDTPFKSKVQLLALQAASNERNYEQTVVWGDRIIQSDPNDIIARIQLADAIVEHTRENDLDKDQSLKKADDYATKGLSLLQSANTPPASAPIDPAKWPEFKQQLAGQAHYALGISAELRKTYPDAAKELQAAAQADPTNALYMARLSKAQNENKQYDDAMVTAQKVIDMPSAAQPVKAFAQQQKTLATTAKGAAK